MKNPAALKYAQVFVIAMLCIVVDQWTKQLAETHLASQRAGHFSHNIVLTVGPEDDGKTVGAFLGEEFGAHNSDAEMAQILAGVTDDGAVRLYPGRELEMGDVVEVRERRIVVVEDHFDLEYTRNEGAAFSFLADADPTWRAPFFVLASVVAVLVILGILRGATLIQQILLWGLALLLGGALGNLIDRVRLGYVIDFIVWKWTDALRWPTFNFADAFIVVGVALMGLEMVRDAVRGRGDSLSKD